jgi:hypothetical protein
MLYLIGGPPRCGKSELALRLCRSRGLPFVSTDLLWGVLEVGLPEFATPYEKGADRLPIAANRIRPYLRRLLEMLEAGSSDFVIEGEVILPSDVVTLANSFRLRSVFLVRSQATPPQLVEKLGNNPWLAGASRELLEAVAAEVRTYSSSITQQCAELKLPSVEIDRDFEAAMQAAQAQLGLA